MLHSAYSPFAFKMNILMMSSLFLFELRIHGHFIFVNSELPGRIRFSIG
jgi:hypothetical protein